MITPITKARDWYEAKRRGERLKEHELPDEEHCDLCACKMQPDPDTLEASGMNICPACMEQML